MMADRIVDGPLVDGARSIEQTANRYKDQIVAGTQDRLNASREIISESPMKSVLIAAGVGAVLGYLIGRRSS
jgi:ElaB/YqjD/DUF883 family membrane-anchored ribosome-binding protein